MKRTRPGCSSERSISAKHNIPLMQLLIRISTILSYITTSYAFQSAAWAPVGLSRASINTPSSVVTSSRRSYQPMLAKRICENEQKQGGIIWSGDNISVSDLFPHRKQQTRSSRNGMQVMMATDNGASADDDNSSPLTKVWLSFRKLMTRLWVSVVCNFSIH